MAIELETIDSSELQTLWENGKTIYAALLFFADNRLYNEYKQAEINSEKAFQARTKPKSDGLQVISEILGDFSKQSNLSKMVGKALDKLKWDFLDKIAKNQLIALAFEVPMTSSDVPQIIPLHVWPNKIAGINWNDSLFKLNGIEFLNIRIIKSSSLKKLVHKSKNNNKVSLANIDVHEKKVGRPSIEEKIIEAYEFLVKKGAIDFDKSLKSHTELIQKTVQQLHSEITDTKGMSYKAISRHLSKRFNTDKSNL